MDAFTFILAAEDYGRGKPIPSPTGWRWSGWGVAARRPW
jgi:hypothetical protein